MKHDGAKRFTFGTVAGEAPNRSRWRGRFEQLVLDGAEASVVVHGELGRHSGGLITIHLDRAGADHFIGCDGVCKLGERSSAHEFARGNDELAEAAWLGGIVDEDVPTIGKWMAVAGFNAGDVGSSFFPEEIECADGGRVDFVGIWSRLGRSGGGGRGPLRKRTGHKNRGQNQRTKNHRK
jgi:hypothetical protein